MVSEDGRDSAVSKELDGLVGKEAVVDDTLGRRGLPTPTRGVSCVWLRVLSPKPPERRALVSGRPSPSPWFLFPAKGGSCQGAA
jgi:hypothetical protein